MFWAPFPEIRREIERVQRVILDEIERPGGVVSAGLRDLATRDSKLLRPAFVVLAARIQSGGATVSESVIRVAAAVEMLHMASLIHDDIVDDASVRRGGAALHVSFGSKRAVLMGDFLFSRCFALMADHATPDNARVLSSAVAHLIGSEIAETQGGIESGLSVRRYLRRIVGKTAVLFALSFHLGATEAASQGPAFTVSVLRRIGYNVGVAFQIVDDLLDVFGDPKRTGKARGTDLKQGILTLPVILATAGGQRARLLRLLRLLAGSQSRRFPLFRLRSKRHVQTVCEEIDRSGAKDLAFATAARYMERTDREIDRLPATRDREILREVTSQLLSRAS